MCGLSVSVSVRLECECECAAWQNECVTTLVKNRFIQITKFSVKEL